MVQDKVLHGQILILQQQLLVYGTGRVRQQSNPLVVPHAERLSYPLDGWFEFFDHTSRRYSPVESAVEYLPGPHTPFGPQSAHVVTAERSPAMFLVGLL
jgi:hypothetical protein